MEEQDRRTLWCGNLPPNVTDELLYELFLQAGPLEKVSIPKDRDGKLRSYAFITFIHEASVLYAMQIMEGTSLYGRNLAMKNRKLTEQQQQQNNYTPSSYMNQQTPAVYRMPQQQQSMQQQAILAQLQMISQVQNALGPMLALQGLSQPSYAPTADMMPHYRNSPNQDYHQHNRHHDRYERDNSRSRQSDRDSRQSRHDRSRYDDKPYSRRHRH